MKKYTKLLNLRTNDYELKQIKRQAETKRTDVSNYIRELIQEDIKKTTIDDDNK